MLLLPQAPRQKSREWRCQFAQTVILSLAIVMIGACQITVSRLIRRDWEEKRAIVERGGRATAVIASASAFKNRTSVTYRYVVDGRTHDRSTSLAGRATPGTGCVVAYDEPSHSLLLAEWSNGGAIAAVILRVIAYIAIAIGIALFIRESRRLQLWLVGTETRADILRGMPWSYRYTTRAQVHTSGKRRDLPFEIDGRVPILVDPRNPSRSTPITGSMLSRDVVEMMSSGDPMLSSVPRRMSAAWNRRHSAVAGLVIAVLAVLVGFVMLVSGVRMPGPFVPAMVGAIVAVASLCWRNQALTLWTRGREVKVIVTSSMRQKDGGQMLNYRYVIDGGEFRGCGAVPRDQRALCDPRTPSVVVVLVHPADPRRSRLVLADEA